MSPLFSLLISNSLRATKILSLGFISPVSSSSLFFSTLCRRRKPLFSSPSIEPPIPKRVPFNVTAHDLTWDDPYHWMSNVNDPDFLHYLKEEDSYAEAFMADTCAKQKQFFSDMTARLPPRVSTPPERWGPWLYYQYIPERKDYPVLCRTPSDDGNGWVRSVMNFISGGTRRHQILLDLNEISEKYGYVHVGSCRISPDHKFLAYTLDTTGSENFTLYVRNLSDGYNIPNCRADGVVSLVWAQDSSTLFYTMSDNNQRPYRVLCTKVGEQDDAILFTEDDPRYCIDITCTKDGKFITINSNSRTSSEVHLIDATCMRNGVHRIHKRVPGVHFFLEHHYGFFYTLTNYPIIEIQEVLDGRSYLSICTAEAIHHPDWQNIILPGEITSFEDMDIFNQHLVLSVCRNGSSSMCSIDLPVDARCKRILELEDLNPWFFPMPLDSCQIASCSNHDFMSSTYRVVLTSPVMPDVIVDYDLSKKIYSVVSQEEVYPPNCDEEIANIKDDPDKQELKFKEAESWMKFPMTYACEKLEVASHDGVKIPLTIIYSRNAFKKGESAGVVRVYGAYGEVLDKSCSVDQLSLLDSGWVLGFADVRGGGSSGSPWHKSGSGLNKMNSVYDFVACCKYMVNEGYVKKDRLAAISFSAGSLLVGAAINMYPDMFCAAILKSPFLDICNTLMDTSLPLTILDHEEFGNPAVESHFRSVMKYSPYDNIANGVCYPAVLVKASFNDSRVGIWEAAKWVAKVRGSTCKGCSSAVILKTEMTGGHFAEGGRYGQCKDISYDYAFLMKVLGDV